MRLRYLGLEDAEIIGGVLQTCMTTPFRYAECQSMKKENVEEVGHRWSDYQAIKVFAAFGKIGTAFATLLFAAQICFKNKTVSLVCVGCGVFESVSLLIACSLCTTAFSEFNGVQTQTYYGLYLVWSGWCASLIVLALALVILYAVLREE
ncbi:uncharacterized protein LOC142337710 [Convolutriloba macropyga]|uniref:uncharacterized protein LOC142337710 n=1 Tax=Convolutriloba macropyga TaxID=536237 RepID=UPI003F523484